MADVTAVLDPDGVAGIGFARYAAVTAVAGRVRGPAVAVGELAARIGSVGQRCGPDEVARVQVAIDVRVDRIGEALVAGDRVAELEVRDGRRDQRPVRS